MGVRDEWSLARGGLRRQADVAGAPAARAAREHVAVVQEAIEHGGDGRRVAEQLAPVFDGTIGGQQRGGAFMAAHDDLQEVLGGGQRELAHAEVVDDEQRHGGQRHHQCFARAVEGRVGEGFEQRVGLAVQDAVALMMRNPVQYSRPKRVT